MSITLVVILSVVLGGLAGAQVRSQDDLKVEMTRFLTRQYGSVENSVISSGVFYDLVTPLAGIDGMDGGPGSEFVTGGRWRQAAHELREASLVGSGLPADAYFRDLRSSAARDEIYPIVLLDYDVDRIRAGVDPASVIGMTDGRMTSFDASAITRSRVFAMAPGYEKTYRGSAVRFRIDWDEFYYTNRSARLERIELDFDDGLGWRAVASPSELEIHYAVAGRKSIRLRAWDGTGVSTLAKSEFVAVTLDAPPPTTTWPITADISYNGEFATGDAYIYLAEGHADLVRPMIVTDGFDIDNSMFWNELYELLNQQNLIETLRSIGFDAVVLNYTNSTTYLQANAYVFEALLDTVEQIIAPTQDYVVVGPSMGGLTTRYALTRLESIGDPARVRTWISFDSPQRGANIPLGLQYWVNYFASQSAEAQFLLDALNSPSARQMLVNHHTATVSNNANPDPLFAAFQNEVTTLGNYPALPRRVAVINGSATQVGQGFNPGAQIILYQYTTFPYNIRGNVWAVNNAASQQIFQGVMTILGFPVQPSQTVTINATSPWDNAPGGTRSTMADMDSVVVPYGDLIALHPRHCFIPSISALDLNVTDPFFNIAGAGNLYSLTTFDSLYFPALNQQHVEVNPENVWWLIDEIVDSLPAPPQLVAHSNGSTVSLNWLKVPAARSYHVYSTSDFEVWPETYASAADTSWSEPLSGNAVKYYRVTSSTRP